MRNKLLFVLSILPLATSCSGFPISREEAVNIVNNVEAGLATLQVTAYTATSTTVANDSETKIVSFYSRESKFFHTYTIESRNNGRVSESWRFVMPYQYETREGQKTDDFIFDVNRRVTPTSVNADLEEQYVVAYELYTAEAWKVYADDYENRVIKRFADSLNHCRSLLANTLNEVELKSFNGNSLFLGSKQSSSGTSTQSTEYEIFISNNQLMSVKNSTNKTNYTETTYKYASGDITYPSFKKINII